LEEGASDLLDNIAQAEQLLENLGIAPNDEVFYNYRFNLALAKLFRNGISLQPFFNSTVEGTNYKGKPRDSDFGGKGLEDLYTFRVGFDVVVPLLRGRGSDSVGAAERAALIEYDASLYSLRHQSSLSVLSTAVSYWNTLAARRAVEITRASVELQERLVQLTQERIDAGEIAQVDLARVQASEARAKARLENALQSLIESRVALAIAMGVKGTDDERTLPNASDDFPNVPGGPVLGEQGVITLATQALITRQDYQAARLFEESGSALVRAAEIDLRPLLDATGKLWWTALDERTVSEAIDRWVGPSGSIQLDFQKPFGNNVFKGRLLQRQADLRRRNITTTDLGRVIQLGIVRSARSLEESAERVRLAQQSVENYQRTVDAEFERFRSGDATLIDAILTEDQQLQARQALISAQQEYARLLAELRFESGLLVTHTDTGSFVDQQNLITAPTPGARR
jgi:outer membrane protein TolC